MKNIVNSDGIVNFRIPSSWVEEYGIENGDTFYENVPDSGTLRLNVLTFEDLNEVNTELIIKDYTPQKSSQSCQVFVLLNGNVLSKYVEFGKEDNKNVVVYYWELAVPIPPNYIRIAIFSYTVIETKAHDIKTQTEIALLDNEIRIAQFACKRPFIK